MRKEFLSGTLLGIAALGAFALSGCEPTAESACKSYASAYCARLDTCNSFYLEIFFSDKATCEARILPRCTGMFDLPGVTISQGDVQACAEAYAATPCEDPFGGPLPEACRFAGDRPDGAACAASAQCKGAQCDVGTMGGWGICGACATRLAAGAACSLNIHNATAYCESGTYCSEGSSTCVTFAREGEACAQRNCGPDLLCTGGVCTGPLPEGAACSNHFDCGFDFGGLCSSATNKCVQTGVAELGGACGGDIGSGDYTRCRGDSWCDVTGKCAARLAEGDACALDPVKETPLCGLGLQCRSGRCTSDYPSCDDVTGP